MTYKNELEHHGILGMKWGVRRYQNYDGSYTQAGMKRYNKSLEKYEHQNERYKSLKKNKADKADIVNAKISRKAAKRQLEKDYRHLKQDKLGDQGKEIYSKGHTITEDDKMTKLLGTVGSLSLATAANMYNNGSTNANVINALSVIGTASLSSAAVKGAVDHYRAKRLRAYYSHTSNY